MTPAQDELLRHYDDLIVQWREDIEQMQSGAFSLRENKGDGWVDITDRAIADAHRRIENLERVVSAYR